ncbi:MAG: beta strand repeat-containing protein [Thermoguttaceae bacterium]
MSISGNLTVGASGTLGIDIAGTTPGTGYDVLAVNGSATLGGTLKVTLRDGFQPQLRQTFTVLTTTGGLATKNNVPVHFNKDPNGQLVPGSNGKLQWHVNYTNNAVILEVIQAESVAVNVTTTTTSPYAVATLQGLSSAEAANLVATVCWSSPSGVWLGADNVTVSGGAVATVDCTGVTASPGTYAVRTTFYADSADFLAGQELAMVDSTATVTDGNNLASMFTMLPNIQCTQGVAEATNLATISNTSADPGNLYIQGATINWDDGDTTPGVITENNINGSISICAAYMHAYANQGTYNVTVTVYDGWGEQASETAEVTVVRNSLGLVNSFPPSASKFTYVSGINVVDNCGYDGPLATFTDGDTDSAHWSQDFAALVSWTNANGQPCEEAGAIGGVGTDGNGNEIFDVYTDPNCNWWDFAGTGTKQVSVQLFEEGGNNQSTTASITVNPGALENVKPVAQLPIDDLNAGDAVQVASFTDTDPAAVSADFTATMTWGGSSCDCFVVPADGGAFDVYASTTTPFAGSSSPITVTISDSDGASASVNDNGLALDSGSTVTLAGLPQGSNLTMTNGTTLNLGGSSVNLAAVSVTGCGIIDGSINAATYTLDNANISANLTGGSLTAADLVSLSGTDSLNGTVTVNTANDELDVAGALSIGTPTNIGTLTNNGTLNVNGSGTISGNILNYDALGVNISDTQTFSGTISGTGSVTMAGSGTLILTGNNSGSSGDTTVVAGTLEAASPAALPGYTTATDSVSVQSGATLAVAAGGANAWNQNETYALTQSDDFLGGASLGIDTGSSTFSYGASISDTTTGPLALVALGSGTLILTGIDNTFSGGTTIVGATVQLGSATALGATTGSLTVDGGTLNLGGYSVTVGTVSVTDGKIIDGSLTATFCSLNDDSALNLTGTSTSNSLGVLTVENGSTITGTYTAGSATLLADDGKTDVLSSIPAGWSLYVTNGTTVSLGGSSATLGAVTVAAGSITDGSIAATACSLSGDSTVALIDASNSLGVVTLEYGSTISGSYTATSVTLVSDDGNTDTLSSITAGWNLLVDNGTTVSLGGSSATLGTVTVTGGDILGGPINAASYALDDATISANLSGGSLTASDLVSLSGTDSLSGAVTVNTACDELDVAGSLSSSGALTDNGTIVVEAGGALTVANTGALTVAGTGTLTVATGGSLVVASGGTLYNEGTLNDAAAVLGGTGAGNVVNSGTLVIDGQGTQTLNCQLSGSGNLAVTSGATFDLAGDNLTFAAVTVNGGSVIDSSGGNGSLTASGFTLSSATVNATLYDSTGSDTVSGTVILNDQTYNSLLNNLDVTSGSTLDVTGGTATLGGSTTNYGTLSVGNGGLFYNGGTFTNYGAIDIAAEGSFYNGPNLAETAGGTLYNYGTINNSGYFQNMGYSARSYGVLSNCGTIANNAGSTFYNGEFADYTGSGYFMNYGSFLAYGDSSVVNAGVDFVNCGTFSISGPGTTFVAQSSSGFYNDGTVNVSGGASFTITVGSINNGGTFNVTDATLNVDSGTTLYNSGTINLATDAVFNNWGIVDNSPGSVTCPSGCAVNNHGTWVGNEPVA